MQKKKTQEKKRLHARNRNRESYDLEALTTSIPELKNYITSNRFGLESLDFSNPAAVKLLNKAILKYYYGIKEWDFPAENLCPAVPGRADYIHHMADLLAGHNSGKIPVGPKITCLDIGIGASCIYPVIGVTEYGWRFIGSDIEADSIASAQNIVQANSTIRDRVTCRFQSNPANVFRGILNRDDKFDLTICNPPFHSSREAAQKGTLRKIKNLTGKKRIAPVLNFAGIGNELIYEGGEYKFIEALINESKLFSKNAFRFSTLVSKESNLKEIHKLLFICEARQISTLPLETGNKLSRIVAWTFLTAGEQKEWVETRW